MLITKEEFVQWLDNPVTNEIFGEIRSRINDATQELRQVAGLDSGRDRYLCGAITAYEDILDINYEGDSDA